MKILEEALLLAEQAHKGQIRTGGADYIIHPLKVAEMVRFLGDEEVEAAALLHDVLEDGPENMPWRSLILQKAGKRVLQLVEELTTPPLPRKRDQIYAQLEKAKKMSPMAKIIKLADRLHNLRSSREVWKVKSQKRYAQGTLALLKALSPLPLEASKLSRLVREEIRDILLQD